MILLTGASGRLGSAVVAAARRAGNAVRPVRHRRAPAEAEPAAWVRAELAGPRAHFPHVEGISAVIHCAGRVRGSRQAVRRDNVAATEGALAWADALGARRFVHVSTFDCGLPDAVSPYVEAKRAAERRVRDSDLDWRIVRPALILRREPQRTANRALRRLIALAPGVPIPHPGARWQPVNADELAELLIQLAVDADGTRETVTAVGPEVVDLTEFLARAAGRAPRTFRVPEAIGRLGLRGIDALRPWRAGYPLSATFADKSAAGLADPGDRLVELRRPALPQLRFESP